MKREKLAPLPAYTNPRTHPPEDFLETGLPMPPNNLQTLPVKKQYNRQEMVNLCRQLRIQGSLQLKIQERLGSSYGYHSWHLVPAAMIEQLLGIEPQEPTAEQCKPEERGEEARRTIRRALPYITPKAMDDAKRPVTRARLVRKEGFFD